MACACQSQRKFVRIVPALLTNNDGGIFTADLELSEIPVYGVADWDDENPWRLEAHCADGALALELRSKSTDAPFFTAGAESADLDVAFDGDRFHIRLEVVSTASPNSIFFILKRRKPAHGSCP